MSIQKDFKVAIRLIKGLAILILIELAIQLKKNKVLYMKNTTLSASQWALKPTFLHLKNNKKSHYYDNISRQFSRLPQIGEEIAVTEDDFYVVESVVHIAFDDAEYSAEVYARKIDKPTYARLVNEAIAQ